MSISGISIYKKLSIWTQQISKMPIYEMSISKISMLRNRLSQKPISEMPIFKLLENSAQFRLVLVSGLSGLLVWGVLALAPQPLIIKVDGQPMVYRSLFRTVGPVLAAAGVKLGPRDLVQPDLGAMVSRGMVISVNRAVKLRVDVDGRSMLVWSPELPVQEVLQTAQVSLGPMDQVSQSRLVREGTPGEGQQLLRVAYVNGNPVQQLQIEDTVLRPPQSSIMAYGAVTSASRGGNTFHFSNTIEVLATAYSARQGRRTCTGALCRFGEVAVDPRVIPLGTRLYIDGYGYATAEDIGGAIKGNRIDLFFESNRDCDRWGLRRTKVYILDD
jgi:3D (Asp-Asp-Asp) domain-containing protein